VTSPTIDLAPSEWRPASSDFGKPIDFGPATPLRHREPANPYLWAAWLGLAAAIIAFFAAVNGQLHPSQTVWGFGMGGYFWGWVAANAKNTIGHRLAGRRSFG